MVTNAQTGLSSVLAEAGFARPDSELLPPSNRGYGGWEPISLEHLADHGADIIAVPTGANYDETILTSQPLYQALPAVAEGRSITVSGDMWSGASVFAAAWVLEDLASFVDERYTAGSTEDVADRWSRFTASIRNRPNCRRNEGERRRAETRCP